MDTLQVGDWQIKADKSRKNKQMKEWMNECVNIGNQESRELSQCGGEGLPCSRRGQSAADQVTTEGIPALDED